MSYRRPVRSLLAVATTSLLVTACGSLLSKVQPSNSQPPTLQTAETQTAETQTAQSNPSPSASPSTNSPGSTSNGTPYPAQVAQNFMSACIESSGGNEQACSCIFGKIQDRYSLQEYIQIEEESKVTGKMPQEIDSLIETCRPQ